jgi:hypothetical protein
VHTAAPRRPPPPPPPPADRRPARPAPLRPPAALTAPGAFAGAVRRPSPPPVLPAADVPAAAGSDVATIGGRRVRVPADPAASLYALAREWVRNDPDAPPLPAEPAPPALPPLGPRAPPAAPPLAEPPFPGGDAGGLPPDVGALRAHHFDHWRRAREAGREAAAARVVPYLERLQKVLAKPQ